MKLRLALAALLVSALAYGDVRLNDLTPGSGLAGTETLPMVQSGVVVSTTPSALAAYLATHLTSLTVAGPVTINSGSASDTTIEAGASSGATSINASTGSGAVTIGNTAGGGTTTIKGIISIAPSQTSGTVSVLNGASSSGFTVCASTGTCTITLGNNTGPSSLVGAGAWTVGSASASNIAFLGSTATGSFSAGAGSGANTITIGNDTGPSSTTINGTLTLANAGTHAVGVLGGASTGALNLIAGSGTGNVNIQTGTATGTTTIGNSGSTKVVLAAPKLMIGANMLCGTTMPTVTSGAGTSPTVTGTNSCAFLITEGATGTPGTALVIGLPAASNGWNCGATDITTAGSGNATQTATSATSVTMTFGVAPLNSDKIGFRCGAY